MTILGERRFFRRGALFALADTLAAHALGGFKLGVGFSLWKCRMCLVTAEEMSTKVLLPSCMAIPIAHVSDGMVLW